MPSKFKGRTIFQFDSPERHKQMAIILINEGVSMTDLTRAFGRMFVEDAKFRASILSDAKGGKKK